VTHRSPRRIRLLRAADLAGLRSHLISLAQEAPPDSFVLVPSRAAAEQLARTLEAAVSPGHRPRIGTRAELYDELVARLPDQPRRLSEYERDAMLAAAARDAEDAGHPPPFHLRPALVAEMVAFYDRIRRLDRSVADFDRLFTGELEPAADSDRGAAQLLEQTQFLAEAFRNYESRLAESAAADEHAARAVLAGTASARPLRHLVVAVADQPFDPDGFWPADVTLFATLAGLDRIDLVATSAVLDAGYRERLTLAFIEIEDTAAPPPLPPPTLIVPNASDAASAFSYRDREDELEGVARRLDGDRRAGRQVALDRAALVVARPLPYLYLAREVFGGASLPFESNDALPLAAEPYAAAVDLVLECAAANFTRGALTALLRSPHFRFAVDGAEIDRAAVSRLDAALAADRYLGGLERLIAWAEASPATVRAAAVAARTAAESLAALSETRPMVEQIARLRAFLDQHERPHRDRRARARAAVAGALDGLTDAYRRHDPAAAGTVTELSSAVRRWIGAHTFALEPMLGGIRIVDAQAAPFADVDDVQIMGLVEGEWPAPARRNVFYPRGLMALLEPSRPDRVVIDAERDHVRFARARFRDLAGLARLRTRLSTFALESESVVDPSTFIDDVTSFAMAVERDDSPGGRVFAYEAFAESPLETGSTWAAARAAGRDREPARFAGEAGAWTLPRVSVSRLERYLKCPFQFYVANVLQVQEEPEDETGRSPLERGRFLHELFETFFHEWQSRGRGRITSREMADARALFEEVAEPALRSLAPAEAGLERARLFGSAVVSGIVDRVFAMEAERGEEIRERLMEYELDGEFTFTGSDGGQRAVRLRAKIDRVDLLGDGTFRLIDYKTKYVPDRRTALQLPIYSACVRTALSAQLGRDVRATEAMYLSFEGPQAVVPLEERGKLFEDLTAAAGHRLVAALDDIARGHYPPRPETRNLCTMCGYVAVCRTPGGLDKPEHTDDADGSEDG
jgi:RecB family exonuclease